MLAWMLYVMMVTLLLSVGAWVAERALRLNRGGTRWIWLAAIAASLCLPMIADSLQSRLPEVVSLPVVNGNPASNLPDLQALSPATWIAGAPQTPAWWNDLDVLLRGMWIGASVTLLLVLVAGSVHVALRMRCWCPTTQDRLSWDCCVHASCCPAGSCRRRAISRTRSSRTSVRISTQVIRSC